MPEGRFLDILDFTAEINFIGGYDKYIYMHLAKHAYRNDFCFVSQQRLAVISSSSLRTVQRSLSKLEKTGLVRVVKEGTFKKYYLTIPSELEALAAKYGLVCPDPNEELKPLPEACTADKSSNSDNIAETHDKFSRKSDNLSHINKDLENNNSPLPPHSQRLHRASFKRPRRAGSFSQSDLSEIQEEFQKLQEHYPRHEDMREAFEVFAHAHDSLPSTRELVSAIEHEKACNGKWQRESGRYVPYLKNWLKFRSFETALQFIKAESELAAKAAAAVVPPAMPEEAPAQEAIGPQQPFVEADFEACSDLWGLSKGARSVMRAYWSSILNLGILPNASAAKPVREKFASMHEWLKHFKQEQYANVSNTSFNLGNFA